MLKEKRFEFILDQLKKKQHVTFEGVSAKLGVSEDTVRRDIEYLHKNGLLSKIRGGAMSRATNPLTFQDRKNHLKKEKNIIALKAQPLIKNGMTVFMDGGTTIHSVAAYFPADLKIRVITNNYTVISALAEHKNIELIVAGGNFDRTLQTFSGFTTCSGIAEYIADVYLTGTCGVDLQYGITAAFQQDAEVKRAMKKNARQTIVLANHERLGQVEAFGVCSMESIDVLITDLNSDDQEIDDFRHIDIQII
ncbi:DeoR/GlpR family DNA-binding transcription regulator [Chitinophaga sp. Cy-1792]|uniref:DeoR/GlpR family DNA-binding transcription regulator n=1 Tax=Chitinophaga sp. Cy-1792 TaxID=2608339 RepID=UPI0014207195|nr:DeoR/GlpR family DNA-binding transcription regulator [Chitinophaga sp. Cy-1792]NIG54528.1 DeoR/GlpR transcriptional regulator [Chitinophaga sp. Cy-1792]